MDQLDLMDDAVNDFTNISMVIINRLTTLFVQLISIRSS